MTSTSFIHARAGKSAAPGSNGWAGYIFGFGLGLTLIVAGVVWLRFQRDSAQNGQRVEGTIIDYIERAGDHPAEPLKRAHYPVFRYQDQSGKQHTRTSSVGFTYGYFKAPEKAEVIYDLRNPEDAQLAAAHYFWLMPLGSVAGGLVLIGYGLRALWQQFNPSAIRDSSSQESQPDPN